MARVLGSPSCDAVVALVMLVRLDNFSDASLEEIFTWVLRCCYTLIAYGVYTFIAVLDKLAA